MKLIYSFCFVTISIYMLLQVSPTDVACCHERCKHPMFVCQCNDEVPKWDTMKTVKKRKKKWNNRWRRKCGGGEER